MAGFSFAAWGNDLYTGRRSYPIVAQRKRWFTVAVALAVASIAILGIKGLSLGIDFRGGTEISVENVSTTTQGPAIDAVRAVVPGDEPRVASLGANALRIQTTTLTPEEVADVTALLVEAYGIDAATDISVSTVGPTWGQGVSLRALWGVVVFVLAAAAFMAVYFRAWRMSVAAIVSMLFDLLLSAGVYALIGWEVTPSTIIGFLTILGFSLYDKMVVFDKVRENAEGVLDQRRTTYGERANLAVNQTLVRSINTSVVALLPVAGILFVGALLLGAGTLRDLSLSLFVGIAVGAASSLFLATPLDVALREREPKIKAHTAAVLAARAGTAADAGVDEELAVAGVVTQLRPGQHLGQGAQPRKKR
ncbi:protein-export membrane protein SecF [Xylanimonas cellulosilytica DSM 15894]|uniref:Protein-export membrane protein SecF n=1 Tax=Xylanimonas cellulosilytica (strain DSM 15894 / JCM 12276 / CECT 5975 / KCTC 9989 / LMG 20990 / NBRC 107835 / XIL07) TaxID=446471 RepID=D1BSK2_XYLCX|nr:protein translocase subunit SecF [Xylanimonas cellulosilytica]ACZ30694.1 protein-export membrane protein SecF [Xylanimonas cellulosilytica DSM 15894]